MITITEKKINKNTYYEILIEGDGKKPVQEIINYRAIVLSNNNETKLMLFPI